jgi:hypothetical protein
MATVIASSSSSKSYPYVCQVDIAFPTAQLAETVKRVMEVDVEIGDRVQRAFSLIAGGKDCDELVVMRV